MSKQSKMGLIGGVAVLTVIAAFALFDPKPTEADSALPVVTVYKSPSCGCCGQWVKHMESNGFKVITKNRKDLSPIKKQFGIPGEFQACHTAKIGKYVVEGHVPASDIKRMLKEKPAIDGLVVPGMPMGSPGMEGPRKDKYKVLAIKKDNATTVFSTH